MHYASYGEFVNWQKANQWTVNAEKWEKDEVEAANSKDIDQIVSFATDNCTFENVGSGIVCKGKEELRNYWNELFTAFPDLNIESQCTFATGNFVCSEAILSGTHKGKIQDLPIPPTGKHWTVKSVRVTELKDGKAYKSRVYFDTASMLQQMGVTPEPPQ